MRRFLVVLLLLPMAAAQLPHPSDQLVHHPLTIESELREIRDMNPELISMAPYGSSVANFPLWKLEFGHPEPADNQMTLYLDANHHGNEQLGMEAVLLFLQELAAWSLTDEGDGRLKQVRVVAAPMINPDGTGTDKRVNTNGVDLNRNYDYNWGLYGTSDMMNPYTGNYRGPSANSEPESAANAAFMRQIRPDVYLSMHTGSHDIVLPWRNAEGGDGPMPDWPVYERWLGNIQNVSGLGYRDPSGAGESISYAYGALGALSLIVEVDNLQNQVAVADIASTLQEEVLIYWDALDNMELLGAWLIQDGNHLVNIGWAAASNVVLRVENQHDHDTYNLTDLLLPNATVTLPEAKPGLQYAVYYDRTLQGHIARDAQGLSIINAAGKTPVHPWETAATEAPAQATPLPGFLLVAALGLALRLRRT